MKRFVTILSLVMMLLSGFYMSSDAYVIIWGISSSSDWGTVGLALGASLMIISVKKKDV